MTVHKDKFGKPIPDSKWENDPGPPGPPVLPPEELAKFRENTERLGREAEAIRQREHPHHPEPPPVKP